jgi:hypothetical protein
MSTKSSKTRAVPAAQFTRNFGHYKLLAQRKAIPVSSHGQLTGYFVASDEYQEFERFKAQRRSFATVDLGEEKIHAIAAARMDSRHNHLDALLQE